MKRFLLINLFLLTTATAVAPSAMARGTHDKKVMDLNNNGVITLQESRLHSLSSSSK